MVTVATGPQPTQPNPFSPVASVGGLLLGRNIAQREQQEALAAQQRREEENARILQSLMAGPQQQQGPQAQVQGRNPLAALPEISLRGGQQTQGQPGGEFTASAQPQPMQTQQPASPQDPGGEFTAQASQAPPAPAPRSSGVGSGPQAQQADPEVEALGQMPGQVGQIFRSMSPEQRTRAVQALRESGSSVSEIMEMVQPAEADVREVDGQLVRVSPQGDRADTIYEGQKEPTTSSRVISGDDPANERFGLGIPSGESARVTFSRDPDTGQLVGQPSVEGRFATQGGGDFTTLSPEESQQMGFPEGAVVQRNDSGELSVKFKPDQMGGDQRDREIQSLARDLEGQVEDPVQTATRIVDGSMRIEVLEDGDVRLVDEAAAAAGDPDAVRALQVTHPDVPRAEIERENTLWQQAEDATGVRSTALSLTGRIPGTETSEAEQQVIQARSTFNTFQNDLARSLANNPRFPVAERQAILNAIDINPSVFDNPGAMRARLRAADRFLRTRLEQFERDAQDESLPQDIQQQQAANAAAMRNAIDRMGVPQAGDMMEGLQSPQDVEPLSSNDARMIINNASDEELGRLPDEVRNALAEKLSNGQR